VPRPETIVFVAAVAWSVLWWLLLRRIWGLHEDDFLDANILISVYVWIAGILGIIILWGIAAAVRHIWRRGFADRDGPRFYTER